MFSILLTTAIALGVCLTLTPLMRDAFIRWGIVDLPDGVRKLHARAIPRAGGPPIVIAYLAAYVALLCSPLKGGAFLEQALPLVWSLMPAAGMAFATGLLDDIWGLKPVEKLGGQLIAAVLAASAGVHIANVAGYTVPEWLGLPLTVMWLVACTNAFNLIDGVDGLAAGVGLLATLTTFLAALLHHNGALALATAPLAACLLGFLRYNFNPASIYLGDSGSLLIGFLLGCYGVIWSQKSATILGMTAPLMALAVPLLDTAIAIARRFLRGKPIFSADRGHVHHRLLDRGHPPRRVALLLYAVCGLGAMLSLVQSIIYSSLTGLVVLSFLALVWVGVQKLEFDEFGAAGRVLFGGELRRMLDTQIALRNLERAITSADSLERCVWAVAESCRALGFSRVVLRLDGETHGSNGVAAEPSPSWHVYVPLSQDDYILLSRDTTSALRPAVVQPLADLIRTELPRKLATLNGTAWDGLPAETRSLLQLAEAIRSYSEQPETREHAPARAPLRA